MHGDTGDDGWTAGGGDELADPARLHLLDETELIEASAAARLPTLDRVARLAARAMRAPVGQVNLVTADAQVPAAAYVDPHCAGPTGELLDAADADLGGAWRRPVGLDASYCQHVVRRGATLVVDDATAHPLVRDSRATREAGIRSYASAPVVTPSGVVLGTVCVVDFHPRAWTDDDLAALAECAALAGEEVAARLGAAAALRGSEERLRLAMQAAQLGSWSVELRSQEVTASPRCRALHGHAGDGEFGLPELLAALHPDDRERMRDVARLAVLEGRDVADEYRVVPAGGAVRWLAVFGRPLRDGAGAVRRVVGLVQDVTDRRLAVEERERLLEAERGARAEAEEARRAAEQANRAKSEFLATMSHELRTPLNAIAGYAELMALELRGPVTARQRDDLARIQRSQRHLLGLINEILDFAKLETGTVHYAIVPVQVRGVLAEAEALVAPLVKGKALTLSVVACDDAIVVRADAEKLRQVLVNLLSNAVKFTPGGGEITIGCEAAGDRALIMVRDTGIGIAADKLQEIFEPFVQVRADLARTAEGTGLGLAISRDLARGMAGELTAESTPGAGSAFTLALPLA